MDSQDLSLGYNINHSNERNNSIPSEDIEGSSRDIIEFKIILVGSVSVGKTSIFKFEQKINFNLIIYKNTYELFFL